MVVTVNFSVIEFLSKNYNDGILTVSQGPPRNKGLKLNSIHQKILTEKESTTMEGEVKGGQLQFMKCDNPVPLDETKNITLSELRQFQLTRESFDCFKKDSQVHTTVNNE